ncbi:hypothetical protein QWJ26_26570 [Streptomyces sp. CSDS2]|uniref:hypothetical protein n=1 Tax=Streptomyces sp. CSDS2 TaxID=3055051 RepID=UPI0025B1D5DC|nr:hypothetical protein [Streptomyces sp. CSDS2]MDN3263310.1 hypothetical protein [Streptomyces sp. CSDS2]
MTSETTGVALNHVPSEPHHEGDDLLPPFVVSPRKTKRAHLGEYEDASLIPTLAVDWTPKEEGIITWKDILRTMPDGMIQLTRTFENFGTQAVTVRIKVAGDRPGHSETISTDQQP